MCEFPSLSVAERWVSVQGRAEFNVSTVQYQFAAPQHNCDIEPPPTPIKRFLCTAQIFLRAFAGVPAATRDRSPTHQLSGMPRRFQIIAVVATMTATHHAADRSKTSGWRSVTTNL
jgi:hypothetical protein